MSFTDHEVTLYGDYLIVRKATYLFELHRIQKYASPVRLEFIGSYQHFNEAADATLENHIKHPGPDLVKHLINAPTEEADAPEITPLELTTYVQRHCQEMKPSYHTILNEKGLRDYIEYTLYSDQHFVYKIEVTNLNMTFLSQSPNFSFPFVQFAKAHFKVEDNDDD